MFSLDTQQWPFSGVTTTALLIVLLYAILYQLQYVKRDPREPTIVGSSIPFIGHPLQMVLEGGKYVKELGIVHRSKQIFTLPVPGSRIYIVTDPALASAVQRASKALSFTPLIADATKRVMGLDAATVDIVRQNVDPEPGEPRGFLADLHDVIYTSLGPGPLLDEFSLDAAREMARQVNAFTDGLRARPGGDGETLDLLSWMQHLVTVGTARFMYGPKNPIAAHPELEQAFWDFDHGLGLLLINVLPAVTATKPYRGREALVRAFAEYIEAGHHHRDAAVISRMHIETSAKHGFSLDGQARGEVSFLFAGIINTAITTFWLVLRIFADRDILAAVRAEIEAAAASTVPEEEKEEEEEEDGKGIADDEIVLGLDAVRTRCRTLHAVFRECLRVGSDNYSTRLVKQDTLLADRHFLAAGSVVQISGGTMHADEGIWGAGAARGGAGFDHERFLRIDGREAQVHPAAFRAFGGGRTLCPGRHFATSEILALAAALVAVLDVEGDCEGGGLRVPEKNDRVLPIHILEPRAEDKVGVRVRLRGGGPGKRVRIVA